MNYSFIENNIQFIIQNSIFWSGLAVIERQDLVKQVYLK